MSQHDGFWLSRLKQLGEVREIAVAILAVFSMSGDYRLVFHAKASPIEAGFRLVVLNFLDHQVDLMS
jgi:hypothetical protein